MMFWCETWEEYPYLESGNYTITLNVSNLEIGQIYDLSWDIDEIYDNYEFNATSEYEHFELVIEVDEYLCYTSANVELYSNGYYLEDNFGFNGDCEEPVSDHFFELYYDNGTEVVMWEQTITYEEFDNCDEYEEGHWECEVDHNDDGNIDHYAHFRDCMWDNSSMTYWCEAHHMPMLEPGEYTLILNATMLDIGTDYELDWDLHIEGMDYNSEEMNVSWTASDEYEHFEWDIEVNESMCMLHSNVEMHTYDTNNSTHGFAYFDFNGLCEEPPKPLELYYNDMLFKGDMIESESDVPKLDAGINYMSWDMIGLEIGDEYNLTWSTIQMGMFEDGEEEEPNIEIFAADSEEMMHDWELEIENDTCMIMIAGVLTTNDNDDLSGFLGMVWAMFNGPCEIDMGDVGLDMLNPDDGDWYEMDGMNGSDTLEMMMFTDSEEDEMNMIMSLMENSNMKLETGNYTMRWAFEDLEIGKEYLVFMDDLLLDMYDDSSEFAYHDNCSEEYNEEEDEWYYLCEVENDDGSIDYLTYEYCYEYNDGMYECEVYDNDDDILTMFNASSDSEYYEWELNITDDTCGHVFVIGIVDAESGEDSMPIALSMYAIAGPNMSSCFGHEDNGPSPEDLMYMTDMDGDGNMSWDEFTTFMNEEDSIDNETLELFYEFFTESDWNGDGTLDMEELSYFIPMIMSLDDDDGMGVEDLMSMADLNGDGNMSWDEFYEFAYNNMGGENIDNETWSYWNGHFDNADMDSDGQLNMTELNEFWYRINDDSDDVWDLSDFALGQDWTVSLGYTDTVNFTFYLGATQILADEFRTTADMEIGDGDGYLNATEAEQVYFWLLDNLDTNPQGPGNITLNGVPAEIVFIGYDIMDLSSDSSYNSAIITTWDVIFHDVSSDDGHYTFSYIEDDYDTGVDTPANFCAVSYEYSYQIMEFVWNGTNIDLADIGECIMLNVGEVVPSFSITYGQEANMDYDNDGVDNEDDAFPYDPSETMDTDGDGWGDNTDAFPNDATEWLDTDGDGVGDNADTDYDGDGTDDDQEDSDGDGVNDDLDDFPNDANESTDTDGDGVGDNSDVFPNDANESSDLDGDGIGDNGDEDADGDGTPNDVDDFPLASSSNDADNDGVVNEIDAFPNNPNEYFDADGDGTGDNADLDDDNDGYADTVDAFPNDASEYLDSDGDGMGDNEDQFPNDANEKKDSDGDGVGDNADAFPSNFNDWADTDNDGVGDNADAFPNDATEIVDSDGDGVGNNADAFPYNANEQSDSDGNGVGDNAQAEQEDETNPVEPEPVDDGGFLPGFSSAMGIVSMLGAAILIAGRRKD
jgi:Ca2+-binding EF-hand superfamily protein